MAFFSQAPHRSPADHIRDKVSNGRFTSSGPCCSGLGFSFYPPFARCPVHCPDRGIWAPQRVRICGTEWTGGWGDQRKPGARVMAFPALAAEAVVLAEKCAAYRLGLPLHGHLTTPGPRRQDPGLWRAVAYCSALNTGVVALIATHFVITEQLF